MLKKYRNKEGPGPRMVSFSDNPQQGARNTEHGTALHTISCISYSQFGMCPKMDCPYSHDHKLVNHGGVYSMLRRDMVMGKVAEIRLSVINRIASNDPSFIMFSGTNQCASIIDRIHSKVTTGNRQHQPRILLSADARNCPYFEKSGVCPFYFTCPHNHIPVKITDEMIAHNMDLCKSILNNINTLVMYWDKSRVNHLEGAKESLSTGASRQLLYNLTLDI